MSLLSRLCHFAANTARPRRCARPPRARLRPLSPWPCPSPLPKMQTHSCASVSGIYRGPLQSKLHCNRDCNRRAINQCPIHGAAYRSANFQVATVPRAYDKTARRGRRGSVWKSDRGQALRQSNGADALTQIGAAPCAKDSGGVTETIVRLST